MSDWREMTLGEIVTFQRGHDLPKTEMQIGEYPVVGSNGIIGYHNAYTTESPSITIGRSGSVGYPFFIKSRSWSHNTTLYIKEYKNADPVFVFYLLQTLDLARFANGSAVPTLNRNHIHPLTISVPSLQTQRAIAEVLSSLDDKIDLLTRQNATLEALAQTYFRQWFVETPDENCEEKNLDEIADFLNGLALQKYPYKTGESLYVIKIKELNNG